MTAWVGADIYSGSVDLQAFTVWLPSLAAPSGFTQSLSLA